MPITSAPPFALGQEIYHADTFTIQYAGKTIIPIPRTKFVITLNTGATCLVESDFITAFLGLGLEERLALLKLLIMETRNNG